MAIRNPYVPREGKVLGYTQPVRLHPPVPLFDVDGQQHSNPNENIKHQSYNFMYDLSNGVKRKETVEWNEGSKDGLNIYGSYEYAVGETLVQVIDPYQIITRCFGYIIRRWIRLIELMNKNNP
ncbi:hypothetical protein GWI33_018273 [Rhynchophorus ferrugineus]|uniref:Uncharacterized protein n=1 Tax=Rhynchophorus ferrugineus TaxID=354439 RepID=A0A834HWN3_RHYFE|nr:hypothetical protein GWI33_018273 [Rhynchophorus ferrugineus]